MFGFSLFLFVLSFSVESFKILKILGSCSTRFKEHDNNPSCSRFYRGQSSHTDAGSLYRPLVLFFLAVYLKREKIIKKLFAFGMKIAKHV